MQATLITAGIACIIAAIVGGGLKAFAIEIPVFASTRRQVALGAFGALILVAGLLSNGLPSTGKPAPGATLSSSANTSSSSADTSDTCNAAWFGNAPPDGVRAVESGAADVELMAPDKPKDRPIVVVVTEDRRPVGAIAFSFFEGNALFKIRDVVTPSCERVESFRNESRGGDRRVIQNWDTLEVTFGSLKYALRLGYDAGTISGQLTRIATTG